MVWGWWLGFSVLAVVCVLVECVGDLVSDVFGLGGDAGGGHWFISSWGGLSLKMECLLAGSISC